MGEWCDVRIRALRAASIIFIHIQQGRVHMRECVLMLINI